MADDRLMMEGRLGQLEQQQQGLELRIEGLCESLRAKLNTAVTPVGELDIPQVSQQSHELASSWAQLQGVSSRIARLQRELGRG